MTTTHSHIIVTLLVSFVAELFAKEVCSSSALGEWLHVLRTTQASAVKLQPTDSTLHKDLLPTLERDTEGVTVSSQELAGV